MPGLRQMGAILPGGELADAEFQRFLDLIYRLSGIKIPTTKRIMVSNRLRRRLRATGIGSFAEYLAFVTSPAGADEVPQFLDEITTNETYFFRDPHHYTWFGDDFLPATAQQARLGKRPKSIRVWSAACSTGEEVYSLALKVAERRAMFHGWSLTLLGTDLSGAALAAARAACYDARALRLVAERDRRVYFDADPGGARWCLKPEVRGLATWRPHNLLRPLRVEPFDCIFLKNVLIYFDAESKQAVMKHLLAALAPGGYLVVGPTEGIFQMLGSLSRVKSWLYQRPA